NVGAIGELRICHDRGGVRVYEHDFVAFFAQSLARLHTRIIEFAALPNDDRARANEEDFVQLIVPRHAQRETMRKPADWKSVILTDSADKGSACLGGSAVGRFDFLCHGSAL